MFMSMPKHIHLFQLPLSFQLLVFLGNALFYSKDVLHGCTYACTLYTFWTTVCMLPQHVYMNCVIADFIFLGNYIVVYDFIYVCLGTWSISAYTNEIGSG